MTLAQEMEISVAACAPKPRQQQTHANQCRYSLFASFIIYFSFCDTVQLSASYFKIFIIILEGVVS